MQEGHGGREAGRRLWEELRVIREHWEGTRRIHEIKELQRERGVEMVLTPISATVAML